MGGSTGFLTCCNDCQPGKPRSLQKDQHILEAVARMPMLAENAMIVMMLAMVVAPAMDPVESRKIGIYTYFVGDFSAFSTSLRLNNVTSSTANPKAPLIKTLIMIDRGTTRAAFLISSDI